MTDLATPPRGGEDQAGASAVDGVLVGGLSAAYLRVRAQTERLCKPLTAEDQVAQSMPDASPTKWHRAHTSWFFDTFLLSAFEPNYQPVHAAYAVLFNSYYNGVGEQYHRPHRGLITRPDVAEVGEYREQVDTRMLALLERVADDPEVAARVALGLHHEQQHQELLLTDLKHLWSHNPLCPSYGPAPGTHPRPAPAGWIEHAGRRYE